ncbi:Heptahelical transmembrane protein 3 [Sesamum angolense]|uniref:Heptahelical transmembrane protein 3 n=1 Tax=Sesamum angolense TaxID=2727404 RepID=A0AAE1X3E7_9LAMI|nr:Heptahelical transmembrane protein 3 [Sesamum angolense]
MKKRRARSGFSFSGQAAPAAGGGGSKEKEKAKSKGRVLLKYEALPEYLKDNEFIRDYYRCEWPLKDVVLSIFSLHNETFNIWTHLLGFMIFMGMMMMSLTEKMSIENVMATLFGERSDGWLTSKTIYRSNASDAFFTVGVFSS